MPVREALILILVILWPEVPHTVTKHLVRVIFVEDEKEARVLATLDHLVDGFVGIGLKDT
jgi:hypothetical protein